MTIVIERGPLSALRSKKPLSQEGLKASKRYICPYPLSV